MTSECSNRLLGAATASLHVLQKLVCVIRGWGSEHGLLGRCIWADAAQCSMATLQSSRGASPIAAIEMLYYRNLERCYRPTSAGALTHCQASSLLTRDVPSASDPASSCDSTCEGEAVSDSQKHSTSSAIVISDPAQHLTLSQGRPLPLHPSKNQE